MRYSLRARQKFFIRAFYRKPGEKMTGIYVVISKKKEVQDEYRKNAKSLKHRGCEKIINVNGSNFSADFFENIVPESMEHGFENRESENGDRDFCVIDGQIHNLDELRNLEGLKSCDSPNEFIYEGYKRFGDSIFKNTYGFYSLIIKNSDTIVAAKDPVGLSPLYILENDAVIIFSSELKAIRNFEGSIRMLQPGHVVEYDAKETELKERRFYNVDSLREIDVLDESELQTIKNTLKVLLDNAVKNSVNVPGHVASLLSGGIDSTIICALAAKYVPNLPVYSIGIQESEDLKHAKLVTGLYPDLQHKVFAVSFEDLKKALPKVIVALETFDAALIRSALPMYVLCSKISPEINVLLTGEGADELFGGYSYLKNMTPQAFANELVELLKAQHATGLQRVDRIPYAFNIEARAPWFDLKVVEYAFRIPTSLKLKKVRGELIEKWIVREVFQDIIPKEIAWRKKAKFSQGVDSELLMRDYFNEEISDWTFEKEKEVIPGFFVRSKEELHYWRIFNEIFTPPKDFVKKLPLTTRFTV